MGSVSLLAIDGRILRMPGPVAGFAKRREGTVQHHADADLDVFVGGTLAAGEPASR